MQHLSDNTDKLNFLLRFYKEKGHLIYLPGLLLAQSAVPLSSEPIIYFNGIFSLSDRLSEYYSDIRDHEPVTVGMAHTVLAYPDPMTYPLLHLTGGVCGHSFSMEISRKYVPFYSEVTEPLARLLSGQEMSISGFAGIEKTPDNEYKIHPVICRFSD